MTDQEALAPLFKALGDLVALPAEQRERCLAAARALLGSPSAPPAAPLPAPLPSWPPFEPWPGYPAPYIGDLPPWRLGEVICNQSLH